MSMWYSAQMSERTGEASAVDSKVPIFQSKVDLATDKEEETSSAETLDGEGKDPPSVRVLAEQESNPLAKGLDRVGLEEDISATGDPDELQGACEGPAFPKYILEGSNGQHAPLCSLPNCRFFKARLDLETCTAGTLTVSEDESDSQAVGVDPSSTDSGSERNRACASASWTFSEDESDSQAAGVEFSSADSSSDRSPSQDRKAVEDLYQDASLAWWHAGMQVGPQLQDVFCQTDHNSDDARDALVSPTKAPGTETLSDDSSDSEAIACDHSGWWCSAGQVGQALPYYGSNDDRCNAHAQHGAELYASGPVSAWQVAAFAGFARVTPKQQTAVFLRNLPRTFVRDSLVALLNSSGFSGCFDFVYVPIRYSKHPRLRYAFVNFVNFYHTQRAWASLDGYLLKFGGEEREIEINWAIRERDSSTIVGLKDFIKQYRNSQIMHPQVPDGFKPAIFSNGIRVPFPKPTKKLTNPTWIDSGKRCC